VSTLYLAWAAAVGAVAPSRPDISVTALHVHTVGKCEGPTFMSAGPHLNPAEKSHSDHAGDMPPLLATSGGKAEARFTTDRFSLAALRDADGSAVMVHALADNHANIPTARYDPDPDAVTLETGDSGARIACGLVR
jgi:Cu-Zn family superoxide dismutase